MTKDADREVPHVHTESCKQEEKENDGDGHEKPHQAGALLSLSELPSLADC